MQDFKSLYTEIYHIKLILMKLVINRDHQC